MCKNLLVLLAPTLLYAALLTACAATPTPILPTPVPSDTPSATPATAPSPRPIADYPPRLETPAPDATLVHSLQDTEVVASWSRTYDLDSLVREANLIAEVRITGIQATRIVFGSPYTDYNATISHVLKAPPGFSDPSIVIMQSGGAVQGRARQIKGDPLFEVGANLLLFLQDMSDNPVHAPIRERKFATLMPGGRFQVKADGKLDSPTAQLEVADHYRGRDKAELEKDVLTKLPALSDYVYRAVQASFLIVEGTVTSLQGTRLDLTEVTAEEITQAKAKSELPSMPYTFYNFTVTQVLEDKFARYKDQPHKLPLYNQPSVVPGQTITVMEMGGTYEGMTLRRTWAQFLQPGTKMLLFLNARACNQGNALCSQSEQDAHKPYFLLEDDADRFIIGTDSHLTALTIGPISQSYHGQPKENLEKDIATEKGKLDQAPPIRIVLPTAAADTLPPTPTPPRSSSGK